MSRPLFVALLLLALAACDPPSDDDDDAGTTGLETMNVLTDNVSMNTGPLTATGPIEATGPITAGAVAVGECNAGPVSAGAVNAGPVAAGPVNLQLDLAAEVPAPALAPSLGDLELLWTGFVEDPQGELDSLAADACPLGVPRAAQVLRGHVSGTVGFFVALDCS